MKQSTVTGVLDAREHALALYTLMSLYTLARTYALCHFIMHARVSKLYKNR